MWGLPVCPLPRVLSRRNGPTNCWSALGPGGVSFCILTAKTHATALTSHWHGPDDCVPVLASPRIRQYWRGSPCSGGSARADAAPPLVTAAAPPATRHALLLLRHRTLRSITINNNSSNENKSSVLDRHPPVRHFSTSGTILQGCFQ